MIHTLAGRKNFIAECGGCRLGRSEYWAERNSDLVHTISKRERWAGIYEDAPDDERASGGLLGLAVNCACAALYMVLAPSCCCHSITYAHSAKQPSAEVF